MAGPTYAVEALVDNQVPQTARKIVSVAINETAAVAIGVPVAIDPTVTTIGQGKTCKVNVIDDNPLAFGVTYEAIAAGAAGRMIRVQVGGPILATDSHNPTAQGTINAGEAVGANNSTTAQRIKAVGTCAATIQPFAVSMTAYTTGNANGSIMIIDKGWF